MKTALSIEHFREPKNTDKHRKSETQKAKQNAHKELINCPPF